MMFYSSLHINFQTTFFLMFEIFSGLRGHRAPTKVSRIMLKLITLELHRKKMMVPIIHVIHMNPPMLIKTL